MDEEEESDEFYLEEDPDNSISYCSQEESSRSVISCQELRMAAAYEGEARGAPIRRKLKTEIVKYS